MAAGDLFGSRDIPLHVAEDIFYLAGPDALTSVRCTSKVNADAYSGVAMSLAKRGQWRCRVNTPEMLQFAVKHRLPSLHVLPYDARKLTPVTSLAWLRTLCLDSLYHRNFDTNDRRRLVLPPRLVTLELKYLQYRTLPRLPLDGGTLQRLVWCEDEPSGPLRPDYTRRTGPLPTSLRYLQCNAGAHLELPAHLPPSLQLLDLSTSRQRTGLLPALPATLRHLALRECRITRLPDHLPPQLTYLDCHTNKLKAFPPLPTTLEHLISTLNRLNTPFPDLPASLLRLDCNFMSLTDLPAQLPPRLRYLNCSSNKLTSLPTLPPSLKELRCSHNNIYRLPVLPESLRVLECWGAWYMRQNLPPRLERLTWDGDLPVEEERPPSLRWYNGRPVPRC